MRVVLGIVLSLFMWGVSYAEIVSVDAYNANLRSSPSASGSYVVLQLPQYYPLKVLDSTEDFYKVSDFLDRTGWIHKSTVGKSQGVVVAKKVINIRKGPGTDKEIAFQAEEGVAFKVIKEQEGWLDVLHDSGRRGWICKVLVWGL